jgi:hypothetical protein
MGQEALTSPLNNVTDPNEERVLGILSHLIPILEDWRSGEDFRIELNELESGLSSIQKEASSADLNKKKIEESLNTLTSNFTAPHMLMIAGGILVIVASFFIAQVGGLLLIGGAAVSGFGIYSLFSKKRSLQGELATLNRALEEKKSRLTDSLNRIKSLKDELALRSDTFPTITQLRCAFPLIAEQILGKNVLLDGSGVYEEVSLETIDLSAIKADLDSIASKIEEIRNVPVLLSPSRTDDNQDPIDSLYGEENTLQKLVDDFTRTLNQVRDIELKIPLIDKSTSIASKYSQSDRFIEYDSNDLKTIKNSNIDIQKIDEFVKQVNKTKDFGDKVLVELKETFGSLEGICNAYSLVRKTSINDVHANLFEVLNRASWCSKRFFCPRTIQSPKYLQDLLSINPNEAHLLQFDDIVRNLKSDQVIAARIKDKPQLIDELYVHYNSIHDLQDEVDFNEEGEIVDLGEKPAYVTDQYREALIRFRRALSLVMMGSVNPILAFSSQAEMHYDPESNEWRSEIVPYIYDTPTMLKYGQVLKINTDLMIPLWEHLWTEKSDFRKSELFRTNESILRMTEKESEKLIEVGNQFRADMRTVRENINLIEADLKSKYDELVSFRDGMASLGLLSDRQKEFLTDEKLKSISLGDRSVLQEGDEYESLLSLEPKAQAERRGTVSDPVDIVRSPDSLISYSANPVKRLTI